VDTGSALEWRQNCPNSRADPGSSEFINQVIKFFPLRHEGTKLKTAQSFSASTIKSLFLMNLSRILRHHNLIVPGLFYLLPDNEHIGKVLKRVKQDIKQPN